MESTQPFMEQPIINIRGNQVALGPLRRDLVSLYLKWMNDFDVTCTYGSHFRTSTLQAQQEWYDRSSKGGPDYTDFSVYERATMRPIGRASLEEINHIDRTAKFVMLIGEKECWGKGYGTETAILTLD
jgi:diamine N-acetyltransferase